jgi:hypothetical protein
MFYLLYKNSPTVVNSRYEVFKEVKVHVEVFWVVTLCSVVVGYLASEVHAAFIFPKRGPL